MDYSQKVTPKGLMAVFGILFVCIFLESIGKLGGGVFGNVLGLYLPLGYINAFLGAGWKLFPPEDRKAPFPLRRLRQRKFVRSLIKTLIQWLAITACLGLFYTLLNYRMTFHIAGMGMAGGILGFSSGMLLGLGTIALFRKLH